MKNGSRVVRRIGSITVFGDPLLLRRAGILGLSVCRRGKVMARAT